LISTDGKAWTMDSIGTRGLGSAGTQLGAIAYKSGVYCGINQSNTTAVTSVENSAKFKLPRQVHTNLTQVGEFSNAVDAQQYIKARS
jgi:hypothetical protein